MSIYFIEIGIIVAAAAAAYYVMARPIYKDSLSETFEREEEKTKW